MAIYCYRCTSAYNGCGDKFHWRGIGFWGEPCPEDDDICVKVIERKGGKLLVNNINNTIQVIVHFSQRDNNTRLLECSGLPY